MLLRLFARRPPRGGEWTRRLRAEEWSSDEQAGWVPFGVPDHTAVLAPLRGALLLRLRCALVGVSLG